MPTAAELLERHSGPLLMGILNVTPDSFSDGGRHTTLDAALAQAERMVAEGAHLIDVGGESTRPGARRVPADEQRRRVLPVLEALASRLGDAVAFSIDTTLAGVAADALDAGASLVNDVAAGRESDTIALAAARGVPIVLMHMQGTPETMQRAPHYRDVVAEVRAFLLERAEVAVAAGVPRRHVLIDPGIGFGKGREHNLALIAHLDALVATGFPVLLGASRKRFMGSICRETEFAALVGATAATTALAVAAGVRVVRVHDVRENRQAAEVTAAIVAARRGSAAGDAAP